MRGLHLARATILVCVAGFGKNVVPLLGLGTWGGFLGIPPQPAKRSWKNRSLKFFRELAKGCFHKFHLPLVH